MALEHKEDGFIDDLSTKYDAASVGDFVAVPVRTVPKLTVSEYARVMGERIQQLTLGAPTTLSPELVGAKMCAEDIANLELMHGVFPLGIRRFMPNGRSELLNVNKLHALMQPPELK